jgi:hypothetical protein
MARFLAAHLDGEVPGLGPWSIAEMQRLHAAEGPVASGMGLGWRVTRSNGRKLICHGGDGAGFTNFMGAYPELGMGIVLTLNRAGAAAARSVIANTVLGLLAGKSRSVEKIMPETSPRDVTGLAGAYRSTYWDIDAKLTAEEPGPVITVTGGLVVSDGGEPSRLSALGGGRFAADGGMLHGFEVEIGERDGSAAFSGGLYPFTFRRTGDIEQEEELRPDESADLTGVWRGTAATPLGPLAIEFGVADERQATVSTPFVRDVALEECAATGGRLSGRFKMTVPAAGEMVIHARLIVTGGKLRGDIYAWGVFGEAAFPAHLERVNSA